MHPFPKFLQCAGLSPRISFGLCSKKIGFHLGCNSVVRPIFRCFDFLICNLLTRSDISPHNSGFLTASLNPHWLLRRKTKKTRTNAIVMAIMMQMVIGFIKCHYFKAILAFFAACVSDR